MHVFTFCTYTCPENIINQLGSKILFFLKFCQYLPMLLRSNKIWTDGQINEQTRGQTDGKLPNLYKESCSLKSKCRFCKLITPFVPRNLHHLFASLLSLQSYKNLHYFQIINEALRPFCNFWHLARFW